MLHILLAILKILGIILLAVVGILLALVFLVLFVPVRYRGDVSFDGKPGGSAVVSWLFRIFRVRVSYDGSFRVCVKALWLRVFERTLWPGEDEDDEEAVPQEDEPEKAREEAAGNEPEKAREVAAGNEPEKAREAAVGNEPDLTEETVSDPTDGVEIKTEQTPVPKRDPDPELLQTCGIPEPEPEPGTKTDRAPRKKRRIGRRKPPDPKDIPLPNLDVEEVSPMEKIRRKLSGLTEKIRNLFKNAADTKANIEKKYEKLRAFITDEENQKTFRLLLRQVKSLFKHILPRRIGGSVRFGFDDPYRTGQVLTVISPFYGLYAKTVDVEPVFGEKILEGELHIKGHIRAATLLAIAVWVFLNKNFRRLLRKLRK